MYLLAIDTATNSGGVAICRNAEVIGLTMLKTPLRYAEHLLCYIDFLLEQLELEIGAIDYFAVAAGPGSFTGLRIGLATAKGLAQNRGAGCVGVSTLEALGSRFAQPGHRVSPLIDARRQQVYGAAYELSPEGQLRLVAGPGVGPASQWAHGLPEGEWTFVGDGAQLYAGALEATRPGCEIIRCDNFLLRDLCQIACRRVMAGEVVGAHELKALYVRPPDIRLPEGQS